MNKTAAQVLKEYKNRQDNPEYRWIGVLEDVGQYKQFSHVSNLENTEDECGKWLEFDIKSIYGTKHIKVHGHIVKYETIIDDSIKSDDEWFEEVCWKCGKEKLVHNDMNSDLGNPAFICKKCEGLNSDE